MRRVRRLLLLLLALVCLAVPTGAGGQPSVTINPVIRGTLGSNSWYVSNVNVSWQFDPTPDQTQGCDIRTITTEGLTHFVCTAWWGQVRVDYPLDIYIDKTPPAVSGTPSRSPDANGWYNHALSVSFSGTDATSGLAGCSSANYGGPDNANATVSGTCTDNAGNVGSGTFGFHYDATPPALTKVRVGHGNRSVSLRWEASPDAQVAEVTRSGGGKGAKTTTVYRGAAPTFKDRHLRPGAKYSYTVTVFDPASNRASKTVATTATGALIDPVPGERVTSRPRLVWLPVKGASYYNVQLMRAGRILSAWPARASFRLPWHWVYHGHRYRLRPGVYRWYVWPGFGKLAQGRYGRLLGGSSFVYAR